MRAEARLQVEFIKGCLNNGKKRAEIAVLVGERWQLASRTFDRRLATATKELKGEAANIAAHTQQQVLHTLDGRVMRMLSVMERIDILSRMALGELKIKQLVYMGAEVGNVEMEVEPSYLDRRGAIAELNKMFGDYAPEKKAFTLNGESAQAEVPTNSIILSNGQQIPFG